MAAAVVGLGSLASGAYSLWKLVPSSAKIEAVVLSCQRDLVSLALVNVGDKPGAVRSVALEIRSTGGSAGPISLSPERGDENLIIEPARSGTVNYRYRIGDAPLPFPSPPAGAQCRYVLSIAGIDFSGRTVPSAAQCDCPAR